MPTKERFHEREVTAEAFLLQQHRTLLSRLTITRISYRIINLAILGFLLANHLSKLGFIISTFIIYVVSVIWFFEDRSIVRQLSTIEKILAREIGGNWEDIYIQTRYEAGTTTPSFIKIMLKSEPFLWFLATATLISFQFTATL
jgi:hypothetical protein